MQFTTFQWKSSWFYPRLGIVEGLPQNSAEQSIGEGGSVDETESDAKGSIV